MVKQHVPDDSGSSTEQLRTAAVQPAGQINSARRPVHRLEHHRKVPSIRDGGAGASHNDARDDFWLLRPLRASKTALRYEEKILQDIGKGMLDCYLRTNNRTKVRRHIFLHHIHNPLLER